MARPEGLNGLSGPFTALAAPAGADGAAACWVGLASALLSEGADFGAFF